MTNAELAKALSVTAELCGGAFSEAALEVLVRELSVYPPAAVLGALTRCRRECRRGLALADVLDRLEDGHPGPEEAWAMVATLTEDDTIVWTDEIARAWGVARPLDRVAGRLAFLEVYRRQVAEARARRSPPRWWVSLGADATRRRGPIHEAVAQGRLSVAQGRAALPPADWPAAWSQAPALPPGAQQPARRQHDSMTA